MLNNNTVISGEITSLAFGGHGILRHEGIVIFVPFTAVGDRITCRITKVKKNFAEAQLIEIIHKSPLRITPRCPYFGVCGGCQLQHMNYPSQVEQKTIWVKDALQRIGLYEEISVQPTIPAENDWAYRRHINVKLIPKDGTYQAGYTATDHKSLVQISECPIFIPPDNPLLKGIQETTALLQANDANPAKLTVLKAGSHCILHFHFKTLPTNAKEVLANAMRKYSWKGVVLGSAHKTITLGEINAETIIDGLNLSFSANVFMQNFPEQSLKIYRQIVSIATSAQAKYVLDLYCGIGITSMLLAKQDIETLGIEYSHKSVDTAIKNAKQNHLQNVHFQSAQVENVIAGLLTKRMPDLVIINPPREGLETRVIEAIKENPPKHLVYVSCMPTTLARDIGQLKNLYSVQLCRPYDMFPQTSHVETLIHLQFKENLRGRYQGH